MQEKMIIVSACLAGIKCRFDAGSSPSEEVMDLIRKGKAIPVCPEQMGGLPTPRRPCEILKGRIVSDEGDDLTDYFSKGTEEVLKIASLSGCSQAILKARSPSCGKGEIYDGSFSGKLIPGNGILAEILLKNGIEVRNI